MGEVKLNLVTTIHDSNEETRNILSKNLLKLSEFNIYEIPTDIGAVVTQSIETIKNKTSKRLLIKKIYKWNKLIKNQKRIGFSREKKTKRNLTNYWQNYNICTTKYSYELFKELKIDKYINIYFEQLHPNCEYPLFDKYEIYKKKTFDNKSLFIQKIHFYNFEEQNSQKNNDIQVINNNTIIININQMANYFEEEYENSFIEDVNRFADEFLRNRIYNNQSSYG